jgi:hypothetical protein
MQDSLIEKLLSLSAEDLSRVYMDVFNTDNGKLVLADLANRCHANISTVAENQSVDPFQVVYKEGRRSVYLHLLTMLLPIQSVERKVE